MSFARLLKNILSRIVKSVFIFAFILIIVFIPSFYLTGGDAGLLFSGAASLAQSSLSGEKSSATQNSFENIKEAWQKIYRIAAVKEAVNEKLNHANYVKLADISPNLKNAVVAIEDNRFYSHKGFDVEGIFRATLVNLQSGALVEGGSTITQQLAKNLFLSQEKDWLRKAEEFILAVDLEYNYSKDEILEMYLNTVYFGAGAYGAKEAADVYFDKPPKDLTLAECAIVAAVLTAPSVNSPYVNLPAAKERQKLVLDAMVRYNYLERSLAQEAKNAPLKFAR